MLWVCETLLVALLVPYVIANVSTGATAVLQHAAATPRGDWQTANDLPTLGEPELVFHGGTSPESCDSFDLPDAPARAWRDSFGQVHLAASWATSRFSRGPDLGSVKHSCDVVFNSTMSGKNSLYADHEWILAPWILEDNRTVLGLSHQEYHGFEHGNCSVCSARHQLPGCVPPGDKVKDCWMVALTSTVSTDGGLSFRHTAPPPGHLVASAPYPYVPNHSEFGYGDPSDIFRKDGYYYMSATSRTQHEALLPGTVLLRTRNLRDWKSWRCWDGEGFSTTFVDPYAVPHPDATTLAQHVCMPVPDLDFTVLSIKYSTHFNAYIATGQGVFRFPNGTALPGPSYIYKTSRGDNLLRWSETKLIRPKKSSSAPAWGISENYASLLDDTAVTANFEEVGQNAWFYFTRQTRRPNGTLCTKPPFCRDLYRQRISFKTDDRMVPKDVMEQAIVKFVNGTQPASFDLDLALAGFADSLTWSFPPRGYPQQISREGFKQHQLGGYNGTLAWSAEIRAMHIAGNHMVIHICDNYIMKNGRMCNWPNVYWRAEFDPVSTLITSWVDFIPSDDNECVGQTNASLIEAQARLHFDALGHADIARAMQLYSPSASSRYITASPLPGKTVEDIGGTAFTCKLACIQAHFQHLLEGFEILSALPSDFNVNGNCVTFALDIEGYPHHPEGIPADGASALIARGVAMWTIETISNGDNQFQIMTEEIVLEQLLPAPRARPTNSKNRLKTDELFH